MEDTQADGHKYHAISHAGGLEQAIKQVMKSSNIDLLVDPDQITRMSEIAQLCQASVRVLATCRGHVGEADCRKYKLVWRSRLSGVANSFQDLGRSGYFNASSDVLNTKGKLLGHFRRKPGIWQQIGIKSPDSTRILKNTKDAVLLL